MIIGARLRAIRESQNLSQGDIEKRTGLLRCYISRVENGHTVPALETIEKIARAVNMPLHHIMYDGEGTPEIPPAIASLGVSNGERKFRNLSKNFMASLCRYLDATDERNRRLILSMAAQMSKRSKDKR